MGRVDHKARVSLTYVARELDLPRLYVARLLEALGPYLRCRRRRTRGGKGRIGMTYDAVVIDYLNQILGRAHRSTDPPADDWLARYLRERN